MLNDVACMHGCMHGCSLAASTLCSPPLPSHRQPRGQQLARQAPRVAQRQHLAALRLSRSQHVAHMRQLAAGGFHVRTQLQEHIWET